MVVLCAPQKATIPFCKTDRSKSAGYSFYLILVKYVTKLMERVNNVPNFCLNAICVCHTKILRLL